MEPERRMRTRCLIGFAFLMVSTSYAADDLTVVVHYDAAGADAGATRKSFQVRRGQILPVDDLEYGDTVEGALVEVRGSSGAASDCHVQAQYQTSVMVANKGPHVDLLDWVHFTSDWRDARRVKKKGFRIPTLDDAERSRFPFVPAWELRDAVLTRAGPGWAELVKDVETPHDPPSSVDVSVFRLRVVCGAGGTDEIFATLEFEIPMGC
jgi:hypothetical protein